MAGLPGTGLGGLFYVLLIFWMTAREAWRLSKGEYRQAYWMRVAKLCSLAAAIVGALWLESWSLLNVLGPVPNFLGAQPSAAAGAAMSKVAPTLTFAPFLILALLLLAMHVMRVVLIRRCVGVNAPAESNEELLVPKLCELPRQKAA